MTATVTADQLNTALDKALLMRTARHLEERAAELERSYTPWGASPEGKRAKRVYDRLLRDARDLRTLAKRLTKPAVQP